MNKLFTTRYGSFLYGTSTPFSDIDLKHIVLPSIENLLLCNHISNEVHKTNNTKFSKNTAEDVDEEFIPLQVFARDFLSGHTYALELAFAVDFSKANQIIHDPLIVDFCKQLREKFLTSNMSALIGYAVNQASLYSFKGERLNAVRATHTLIQNAIKNIGIDRDIKISECSSEFFEMAQEISEKFPKYFQVTQYAVDNHGTMRPCFKLLEKTLPFSNSLDNTLKVISTHLKKYGSRADAASIENVDWKATMHAYRVCLEGVSLLKNRSLVFPFDQETIDILLNIKHGKIPYADVIELINTTLNELKNLEQNSIFPQKTAIMEKELDEWLLIWLKKWYNI
jgi:hypothetical protein